MFDSSTDNRGITDAWVSGDPSERSGSDTMVKLMADGEAGRTVVVVVVVGDPVFPPIEVGSSVQVSPAGSTHSTSWSSDFKVVTF